MKSCWYISATGNPAASVPAGFTPEGLPVGVQIVGPQQRGLQCSSIGARVRRGYRFWQKAAELISHTGQAGCAKI
jgi:amidase